MIAKVVFAGFVLLGACAAATTDGFNIGSYLADPPVSSPLATEGMLLDSYGPGCVKSDLRPAGLPIVEHHVYFDQASKNWVDASVLVAGPEARHVVGVTVTSIPLCADKKALRRPLGTTTSRGVALGEEVNSAKAKLGTPLRTAVERLGSEDSLQVLEYFPVAENPSYSLRLHIAHDTVVGISTFFSE